jgi:hypothetical protein
MELISIGKFAKNKVLTTDTKYLFRSQLGEVTI